MSRPPETARVKDLILVPTDVGRVASGRQELDYELQLYLDFLVRRGWIYAENIERKYGTHGQASYETLIEYGFAETVER